MNEQRFEVIATEILNLRLQSDAILRQIDNQQKVIDEMIRNTGTQLGVLVAHQKALTVFLEEHEKKRKKKKKST